MRNGVVMENPLPRADVPADIGVNQQSLPSRGAGAHEHPHQNRQEKKVRKRRNQNARPPMSEHRFDTAHGRTDCG